MFTKPTSSAPATCPSAKIARDLINALKAYKSPDLHKTDPEAFAHLDDQIDATLEAATFARPITVEGALLHLVLGASIASDLARATNPAAMERRAARHFYAARAYLESVANLPKDWEEIFAFAMLTQDDPAQGVEAARCA